jgi:hypothetical protein
VRKCADLAMNPLGRDSGERTPINCICIHRPSQQRHKPLSKGMFQIGSWNNNQNRGARAAFYPC